jgi:hypothetical protein
VAMEATVLAVVHTSTQSWVVVVEVAELHGEPLMHLHAPSQFGPLGTNDVLGYAIQVASSPSHPLGCMPTMIHMGRSLWAGIVT